MLLHEIFSLDIHKFTNWNFEKSFSKFGTSSSPTITLKVWSELDEQSENSMKVKKPQIVLVRRRQARRFASQLHTGRIARHGQQRQACLDDPTDEMFLLSPALTSTHLYKYTSTYLSRARASPRGDACRASGAVASSRRRRWGWNLVFQQELWVDAKRSVGARL